MYWQLLRGDRILRNYWSGALVSRLGSNMTMIALAWIVLDKTHSPLQSSMVYAFASLPVLLGGPVVGTLVDRLSRKRMMLTADIARSGLILLKTLTCTVELYSLNDIHDRLKKFLNAHSGFNRDSL